MDHVSKALLQIAVATEATHLCGYWGGVQPRPSSSTWGAEWACLVCAVCVCAQSGCKDPLPGPQLPQASGV